MYIRLRPVPAARGLPRREAAWRRARHREYAGAVTRRRQRLVPHRSPLQSALLAPLSSRPAEPRHAVRFGSSLSVHVCRERSAHTRTKTRALTSPLPPPPPAVRPQRRWHLCARWRRHYEKRTCDPFFVNAKSTERTRVSGQSQAHTKRKRVLFSNFLKMPRAAVKFTPVDGYISWMATSPTS